MEGYDMYVISHTHWDREWYQTFQEFRIRLVDLVDNLLKILDTDPDFKYFNFDGQTIVLEDYLQIRPENEEKLRNYIREGRILVGPWYQLNDEYLVSGESTVRSLLIGHRIAKDFGGIMKVGYLPDQFGNISQMPQIFREFGIDNSIFGRGLQLTDDRRLEFIWESPDGSSVVASLMAYWYNNAQRFPEDIDEAVAFTKQIKETMAPHSATEDLLLMNGVDHLEAQDNLSPILKAVNERLGEDKLIHATMPQYIDAIKQYVKDHSVELQRIKGELREDRHSSVLAGTLSARVYIKQANDKTETMLEKYAEPTSAFAWMLGKTYPAGELTYAWKYLMQNHPHDSICGCSIDQVHYEMMPRFDQVQQVATEMTKRSVDYVASKVQTDAESLVVFNTLNWVRTDLVSVEIDIPVGKAVRGGATVDPSMDVNAFELWDSAGKKVPFKLLDSQLIGKRVVSPIELPFVQMTKRFSLQFVAESVPSLGYKTYSIKPTASWSKFEGSMAASYYDTGCVTNGLITVGPEFGGVTVYQNETFVAECEGEKIYANLGLFEDGADVGDEYLYAKPLRDQIITNYGTSPEVTLIDNGPVSATMKVSTTLRIPAQAAPGDKGRSDEMVDVPITSWYTVTAGSPRVDIVTEIDNHAKDHRLRVLFPTGIESDVAYAEGQFDVIGRPAGGHTEWPNSSKFFPMRSWVDVNDGRKGLTVINKGLREYELYKDDARTLAVTLLRCVGRLSGGGDTPDVIPTPGAQCQGTHRFEYSVFPHKESWEKARVWRQAHQMNVPMIVAQTGAHDGELPADYSFIEFSADDLIVTAVKKSEDRNSVLVRFYNPREKTLHDARLKVANTILARRVNLNEEPGNELIMKEDGSVLVDVPGKKIATIEFVFGE